MIAGLMREGKEFEGKEIAGKISRGKRMEMKWVLKRGTTRISADPIPVCCNHLPSERAHSIVTQSIHHVPTSASSHPTVLRSSRLHRAYFRVIVSAFYRQFLVLIIASLGRKT